MIELLSFACLLSESTKRLCMRKKKKKKVKNQANASEASFLRSRRTAVAKAASSRAAKRQPPAWMRKLSRKLWSKQHTAELEFNRKKYRKKAIMAYKAGMLKPRGAAEKRKFQKELSEEEQAERKRRQVYDRSIAKRC